MMKPNEILENSQTMAEACVSVMREHENFPTYLKIELSNTAPGEAIGTMVIENFMLNGHQTCHGGVIFSFADTIFAYACNNRNQKMVSSGCSIDFMAPAFLGDQLTARAETTVQAGRNGIYDVVVTNQNEQIIAVFRGKSRTIPGLYIEA